MMLSLVAPEQRVPRAHSLRRSSLPLTTFSGSQG
jgi:hypothetical protein